MTRIAVRILHAQPRSGAGPLERLLADARLSLSERHAATFRDIGVDDVQIVSEPADDTPFGARLRPLAPSAGGLVILGSGALPLARRDDLAAFVRVAGTAERVALANNRFSSDAIAVAGATSLRDAPDLPSDNALPRWLEEVAGYRVTDLRRRWWLQVDLDSPIDLVLVGRGVRPEALATARERLGSIARIAADRRAELVVTGRTSGVTLAWVERATAARVRALVEERGLRASSPLASDPEPGSVRPPRSVLGLVLDRDGPEGLGSRLAELGEAAIVDTRVLLAHRLGRDERGWPAPEDRFASDLLLPERIADPWLRELTSSAARAPIPIALGGHSLVGPGLRLALRPARWT